MRILSHFSVRHHLHHQRLPVQLETRTMILVLVFLVLATNTVIQAVPTRLFNSASNKLTGTVAAGSPLVIPEEELELENLKGSSAQSQKSPLALSEVGVATKKSEPESTTARPIAYVKKPENEETPALSDNANSLKYGGANADLEEALANMAHIPPSKSPTLSVKPGSVGNMALGDFLLQQQEKRTVTSNSGMGLLRKAAGLNLEVDYTPQDIAEYIFWQGDERGVELAINDFIQAGLITPQDAIRFLEDVKAELNSLQNRYASTISHGRYSSPGAGSTGVDPALGFLEYPVHGLSKKQSLSSSSMFNNNLLGSGYPSSSAEQLSQYYLPSGGKSAPGRSNYWSGRDSLSPNNSPGGNSLEDVLDYEEIVEKLRQVDAKTREAALQGVIYQLARQLFIMGLQENPDVAAPTFPAFVENLASIGQVDLEKSVLDTMLQALMDAANERGVLLSAKTHDEIRKTADNKNIFTKSSGVGLPGLGTSQTKPILIKKKSV